MSEASCEELRDALLAGRAGTEPALEAHAEQCEQCAALLLDQVLVGRLLAATPAGPSGAEALWPGLDRALAAESGPRAWLRSRSTNLRIVLALGVLVVVVLLGTARLRPDWATVPGATLALWLGAFVATGLGVISLALPDMGRKQAPRARERTWLIAALALPAAYALTAAASLARTTPSHGAVLEQALACFGYGLLLSAPLLALFWLLDRGAGPRGRFLAAAAATGLAANGALLLHCPLSNETHLLLGHATIGVVLALAGWVLAFRGRPG